MPSAIILTVVFVIIGIFFLISGGIIVGSVKKLSGDETAKNNIERVGWIMNIFPGIASCLITAFFMYKAKQSGSYQVSPLIVSLLCIILGVCLIISGGIIVGSINKLSGDETAKNNVKRMGVGNILPGSFIILGTIALYMMNRSSGQVYPGSAISPM